MPQEYTLRVKDLIKHLQSFDEDLPIFITNENSLTYFEFGEWSIGESQLGSYTDFYQDNAGNQAVRKTDNMKMLVFYAGF